MFAKFNHPRQYHHHQHQIHLPEQEQEEESEASPNSNSKSGGVDGARSVPKKPKPDPDSGDCFGGGTLEEAGKRLRGRPPGSKNKPKQPPLFITGGEAGECAMRPVFLELPVGLDVIDAIARFTHRRNLGLTVLSASGSVTNVSFRQPSTAGASGGVGIVKFLGRFEILSISATFLPPSLPVTSAPPTPLPSSFTISVVGPQGQIIGGSVAGSLITSSTVYIVAASFDNPTYHRLPILEVMVDQQHEESCSNPSKANNVETSSRDGGGGMPPHSSDQDLIWSPSSPPF